MDSSTPDCLGHCLRGERGKTVSKLKTETITDLDKTKRAKINSGPTSVETCLEDLEVSFSKQQEWKVIKEGGVLNIPIEEFRLEHRPKPNHKGETQFGRKGDVF